MSGWLRKQVYLGSEPVRDRYDVVIIGGGGHGLGTAYYLAAHHGITNVAVFERGYIGGGGTGRNTTVIRSNYIAPETVPLYQRSLEMYEELSRDLGFNLMVSQRGLLWLAHSEHTLNSQVERASINQQFGVDTQLLTPEEIRQVCPVIDMQCGARPILGGAYHPRGKASRHDGVAWGYAARAWQAGVHIHQGVGVIDVIVEGGRAVGVETTEGRVTAGAVHAAVGGFVSTITRKLGIRLPITSHPLQAFVTESYKPILDRVVASDDLHFYVSQTSRGEILVGAEIDPYPSYSTRSTWPFLASASNRLIDLFPWTAKLRILRQWTGICDMTPDYSPIMGRTPVEGFTIDTGLGTWGFKLTPVNAYMLAELIATGTLNELIAPFSMHRFRADRAVSERKSAGTH